MELAKSEVGRVRLYFGVGNWDCGVHIGLELRDLSPDCAVIQVEGDKNRK